VSEAAAFVPLDFPPWLRWGQRRGAFIDNDALAERYPDHRRYVWRDSGRVLLGTVRRCGWCARECPKRRTAWCSDACSAKFYRVWSWGTLTEYIFARDEGACRRCGSEDGGPAKGNAYSGWQVDHIVPVKDGGTDDPANLRLLCHGCHVAVGYEQRAARRVASPTPQQTLDLWSA
jgi:5-methylcytosine-specific restriction endonuclease McrA